jgi:hypothetical protein
MKDKITILGRLRHVLNTSIVLTSLELQKCRPRWNVAPRRFPYLNFKILIMEETPLKV